MSAIMFLKEHYKISLPVKKNEQAVRIFVFALIIVLVELEGS